MKHNIIKTEKYLLAIDDSEIKEGDWIYESDSNSVNIAGKGYHNFTQSDAKITAYLPLNNSPVLEGVPLLPPLEDGVERLVKEHWEKDKESNNPSSFKSGYNKAKEKYKYTEEDIRVAIDMARNGNRKVIDTKGVEYLFILQEDKIIQSLQQPKLPVAFECETEVYMYSINGDIIKPKTTANPQGQTEWVGKYIY
jgi:hypothetical protein